MLIQGSFLSSLLNLLPKKGMIKMTNKDLADLIFPNLEHDVDYYESLYPERELKEGEKVTRFAPSPTGYMHIGGFYQALTDYIIAKNLAEYFILEMKIPTN